MLFKVLLEWAVANVLVVSLVLLFLIHISSEFSDI